MELKTTNSTFQGFRSSKQNCKGLFAMMNATNEMQNCSFQRGGVVGAGGGATQATFLAPGGASLFRFHMRSPLPRISQMRNKITASLQVNKPSDFQ